MGLLLLLARGDVLEPHEQGDIVLEVFGGYAAVGAQETADVHVHGVDVLQMLVALDLGLMFMKNFRGIGGEERVIVAVGSEIIGGDLVLIRKDHGVLLLDVLTQGRVQFGGVHEANTGHHGVEALVAVLDHTEYTSLALGRNGFVIGTALVGFTGHVIVGITLAQASLVEALALHVIALIANGKQHLVQLDLTGHKGRLLMQTEGMEDLVAPCKSRLNTDIALLGALFDGSAGYGEFNKFLPNGGSLVSSLEGGIGGSHEEVPAALAEVSLVTSLEALLHYKALAGFCLAVRAIGLLVLEGVFLNQAIAVVSVCAVGGLHQIHDLLDQFLLLAGRDPLQHRHQLIQVTSSCHNFSTS